MKLLDDPMPKASQHSGTAGSVHRLRPRALAVLRALCQAGSDFARHLISQGVLNPCGAPTIASVSLDSRGCVAQLATVTPDATVPHRSIAPSETLCPGGRSGGGWDSFTRRR